ncbi:MAG: hypothetical protein U0872_07210 [Planctomycetaceae bacterium]
MAILVDVLAELCSGPDLGIRAIQAARKLKSLPADVHLGLFTTLSGTATGHGFHDEANRLEPAARRQVILDQLANLKPSWGATRLGAGLAQTVQAARITRRNRICHSGELWLIFGLLAGSDLAGLAGIDWPESMRNHGDDSEVAAGTNAGMQWVESPTESS